MIEADKKKIADIARKHGLALVVLFGSQARGDARKNSDFDIAYSSIKPIDLHAENKMSVEFHYACKTTNVELVNLSNAEPLLLKRIVDEATVLYEAKESLFNQLYLYAQRVFRDAMFLNDLRREYVFRMVDKFKKDVATP